MDTFLIFEPSIVGGILKVSVLVLFCYFIYCIFHGDGKSYNYPPGPAGLPVLGNILSLILSKKQQHEVVAEWTEKYGDVLCIKLLNIRLFVLSDARQGQELFSGHHIKDRLPNPVIKTLTGRNHAGIVFMNGDGWEEQRRFMLSVLKKGEVDGIRFEEIIGAQAERVVAEMEKTKGHPLDPEQLISTSICNIIMKIVTGVSYEYDHDDDDKLRRILMLSQRIFDLLGPAGFMSTIPMLSKIPTPSSRELTKAWSRIYDFIRESINSHKSAAGDEGDGVDFISSYLQEMAAKTPKEGKGSFDDINLLASCFEMFIGGMETSATNILWCLHTLASYPEVQRRVRQEIIEIVGRDRLPCFSDRNRMPITMAAITESMRLRPVLPFPIAHVSTQDCKIAGYDIPKGSPVTFNIWHLAQSPILWDKPREYRPERFLSEDGTFDRKQEPLHFGTGRRVCPGEALARTEIFLYITYILQRFKLSLAEGVPVELGSRLGLTVRPEPFKMHAVEIL